MMRLEMGLQRVAAIAEVAAAAAYGLTHATSQADERNLELLRGNLKLPLTRTDAEFVSCIVPVQRKPRVLAILIGIGQAVVEVKTGIAIFSGIDPQFDGRVGILARVLLFRAHGQNAARPHVERQNIQRRGAMDHLTAGESAAGPEV